MQCQYPKCRRKATNLHHQQYRSEGGSDDPNNLVPYCAEHHKLVHSQRGDFARWGQKGGKRSALTLKFLNNLKQYRDNPDLAQAYLEENHPNLSDTFPSGG